MLIQLHYRLEVVRLLLLHRYRTILMMGMTDRVSKEVGALSACTLQAKKRTETGVFFLQRLVESAVVEGHLPHAVQSHQTDLVMHVQLVHEGVMEDNLQQQRRHVRIDGFELPRLKLRRLIGAQVEKAELFKVNLVKRYL